jgi:hypothetical protein
VATPDDPHLVQIGELVVDASGNGRISFHVPVVKPGNYVLMVFCPSCAATSAGRSMLAVAEFRVTPAPPSTDTLPSAELPRPVCSNSEPSCFPLLSPWPCCAGAGLGDLPRS